MARREVTGRRIPGNRSSNDKPLITPLVVGTADAQVLLGCGKTKLFELLPELDTYLEGSKRMITVASIAALIERRLAESRHM